jgi:hypothetical protein
MTQAGTADYSIVSGGGTTTWWSDDQLQEVLDTFRTDLNRVNLRQEPEYEGGTALYYDYYAPRGNLEEAASGSIAWAVENSDGDDAGTATYSADYIVGLIRFSADQAGTAYYLRARSYDLNAAAAHVWREKAAWRAEYVSFTADDQSFNQSEWFTHCWQMADRYETQSGSSDAILVRSDLN